MGIICPPGLVGIGLNDLPKFGGAMAIPAPPGTTHKGLDLCTEKVHKSPLWVNVIGVSQTPKIHDALMSIQIHKICVKKQVAFLDLF